MSCVGETVNLRKWLTVKWKCIFSIKEKRRCLKISSEKFWLEKPLFTSFKKFASAENLLLCLRAILVQLIFYHGRVNKVLYFETISRGLRTFLRHFWAGVSNVHAYACLRKAYRLTSHSQGAWRNRGAQRTMNNKIAYFIHAPAQKWARIVLRTELFRFPKRFIYI